ncbi:hypothetical protein AAG570_006873, partial [Ranatra chinensis]
FFSCDGVDSVIAYVQIEGKLDKIDSYCGLKLPSPIMSNGPRLELEFRGIHSSRHSRGFRAAYFFTENFGIGSGEQMSDYPCAFRYRSEESHPGGGTFSSPNFPGLYPRDTECHYFFHGANYQRVRIHFHYFDVEGVLPYVLKHGSFLKDRFCCITIEDRHACLDGPNSKAF